MRKGDRLRGAQLRTRQPTWRTAIAVVKERGLLLVQVLRAAAAYPRGEVRGRSRSR